MKKRGLIISTIVMMLVVVVALSTATYAWFAVSADAKISTLTVQTAASDGLQIAAYYDTTNGGDLELQSGTMTLPAATKLWTGTENAFGAELLFESALQTAYGVTGTGAKSTMYTAASRTATSYETTEVNATWWAAITASAEDTNGETGIQADEEVACIAGIQFYSNVAGTVLAAGANYQDGLWAGAAATAEATLTGAGLYVRTPGFYSVEVTSANAAQFNATNKYYIDKTCSALANDGTSFIDGVWQAVGADPKAAATTAAITNLYAYSAKSVQITVGEGGNIRQYFDTTSDPAITNTVFYSNGDLTTVATGAEFTAGEFTGTNEAADAALVGLYAEDKNKGDIETGWTYEANNSALTTGNAPRYLIPAVANNEYFQLNFALKTQRGMVATTDKNGIADVFIKKLTVTASGGMAAATRIALISYDKTTGTNDVAATRWNGDGTLVNYFVPFNKSEYSGTDWANGTAETCRYNVAPASKWFQGNGFAYKYATSADLVTTNLKTDLNEQVIQATGTWQTATFFNIDKNTVWANKTLYTATQAASEGTTDTNNVLKNNSVGTFTAANTYLYYQLVIWFEGTDTQCVSTFAGTGVTVDLAFDFYQQWK